MTDEACKIARPLLMVSAYVMDEIFIHIYPSLTTKVARMLLFILTENIFTLFEIIMFPRTQNKDFRSRIHNHIRMT